VTLTEEQKNELNHLAQDLYNAATLATFGHDYTAWAASEFICKKLKAWVKEAEPNEQ